MNNQWNNAVQQYVRTRPLLVTILGVVSVIMGLWALCAGVVGMGVATLQLLTCSLAFGTPIKALVTGVLRLMVGSALLNGSGWARMATIIISVVNLVVIIMPGGYGSGEFWNALLSIGMIVYMMTPGVTRWFEGR
ncbi:MAG: hypothetical protein KF716_27195 [Anaerolineae bacterium]|nr:hypothetical protein [Anaerolineae bacterium]